MLTDKYRLDRQNNVQVEFWYALHIGGIKFFSSLWSAFRESRHKRAERESESTISHRFFDTPLKFSPEKSDFFFPSVLFASVIWFTLHDVVVFGEGKRRRGQIQARYALLQ